MKEYRIIRQHGDAQPFSLWTFTNFTACYMCLQNFIKDCGNCFSKDYYVYNDFYENECSPGAREKFKIEVRDVGEWRTYKDGDEKEDFEKNNKKIVNLY